MKNLRKSLIIGVMMLTTVMMSGINVNAAAPQAGDLIKMDGISAVYFLGNDGKRYVYPNSDVFFSWHKDFSGVITVSASELASYPIGSLIAVRPGTKLVKITTDPSVYAVEANGVLRKIQSEADAIAIYGATWAKRVIDVNDSFFAATYTVGSPLTSGSIAAGTLVKNADSAAIYLFDGTNYRSIATEAAFNANRYDFANVVTRSMAITAGGTAITTGEFAYDAQGGGTNVIVTGSGLTASLSAATPSAMNVPGNSPVEMLKINLTAANDGAINVSGIKLTAYGLSTSTNIDNVTFYDNGVKVGTSKDVNSDREASFNFATPIYVAAGATKALTVKATIAATTGSYGLGIAKASDITSSGATVSGSFPITGNIMSATESSVGTIEITDSNVAATVSFGEDSVTLADLTLTAGNSEDALLKSISLYNGGTNANDIISNAKLIIDGEEVATGVYADRYLTFMVNNYVIEKGGNVSVEVKADMGITSSGDTVKLYLKDTADLTAVGKTHGFNLAVTSTSFNELTEASTITLSTGDFTIDMNKTATPAKDVKPGDDNVVLATVVLKSNGENATITGINGTNFYITENSGEAALLENIELVDKSTGGVYDLSVATTSTSSQMTLDDEIALVKGVAKTFEVRADILDTVDVNTTFVVTLNGAALTIEGDVSGAAITDITPSTVSGSIITVKDASLTVTPTVLTGSNVVGGAKDVVVYQAKVKAGTADSVKIQSVVLTAASSSDLYAFNDSNVSKLSLWLNGKLLKEVSNQINETAKTITFSSLNSANYTVAAGQEVDLVVKADFASTITAGDFTLKLAADAVTARAVSDGDTVSVDTSAATPSRIITAVAVGTLAVNLVTTDAKANRDSFLLAGSQTEAGRYLGELKFVTANEAIKVKTLVITEGQNATNADLSAVKLVKADGTVVATQAVSADGSVTFDPFDVVFEADKTTSLFLVAVAKGLNVNNDPTSTATAGRLVQYTLASATAIGNESGATVSVTDNNGASKTATVVASKLNTVVNAMTNATLVPGVGTVIGKYTLTFENGSNRDTSNEDLKAVLTKFAVTIATSSAVGLANIKLNIDGTSDKATTTSFTAGVATWNNVNLAALTDTAKVDGTITLVVTADVTTTAADGEYVQTSITDVDGASNFINYSSNAVDHTSMFLPVTDVTGAVLSE